MALNDMLLSYSMSILCFIYLVLIILQAVLSIVDNIKNLSNILILSIIHIYHNQSSRCKSVYFRNAHNFGGNAVHINFLWGLPYHSDL